MARGLPAPYLLQLQSWREGEATGSAGVQGTVVGNQGLLFSP